MRTVTWIYQSDSYTESAARAFEEDLTKRYAVLAEPRGFDFRVLGAAEMVPASAASPRLLFRGEDLLARRQAFVVEDAGRSPQSTGALRTIYRTVAASDSVLLNRSFNGPDYLERDKLSIVQHAAKLSVPTIGTVCVPTGRYARLAVEQARRAFGAGPYLLKPRELSMGVGVLKVDSEQHLKAALDIVAQSGFGYVVQPFLANTGDMRVFVADGRVVSSLTRRPGAGGYLASLSEGGSLSVNEDHALVSGYCERIAASLGAEFMCVDWLMTPDGPVLNEWSTAHGGFTLLPEPQLSAVADAYFGWISRKCDAAGI